MNINSIGLGDDMFANKMNVQKAGLDAASTKLKSAKSPLTGVPANDASDKVAEEFESVFLAEMFSHMFKGVKPDTLFGGGHGEEMWKSFLVQEYAKVTARSGGIGIADQVKREILRIQEASQK